MNTQSKLLCTTILGLASSLLYCQQEAKTYDVRGTVINSRTGNPIARVLVFVRDPDPRMAVTDEGGRFAFEGLHTEQAQIHVAKAGFISPGEVSAEASMEHVAIAASSHSNSVVIKLSPTSAIHGRITSLEGDPLEAVPITLFYLAPIDGEDHLMRPANTITNEEGEFRFNELAAGQYFIAAGPMFGRPLLPVQRSGIPAENYGGAFYPGVSDPHEAAAIELGSGQDIAISLSLKKVPLFTLRGRVTGWRPGQSGTVQLLPAFPADLELDSQFDSATGQFRISQVPLGDYTIRISAADGAVAEQELSVRSDISNLNLASAQPKIISVILHGKDRGAAQAYVSVTLKPEEKWQQVVSSNGRGRNGETLVPEPSPGKYWVHFGGAPPLHVTAATCGATDLLREPLVVTGQNIPPIELTLSYDSATLSAQVQSLGLPAVAQVLIVPIDPPGESRILSTSIAGKTDNVLAPGTYRVWAFDKPPRRFRAIETMGPYSSLATIVTLAPNQRIELSLEMLKAEENDEY